ncbi:helix-turn-helix transcriptional regulator [Novilysobacter erysipheiresistens]|uniref:Helix-turn-helix transcriptional regulator n=1 Tax=Novilysobacter erysipheiresistens TaxID=1749332 RepID=A0ABU7YUA7_9GAMM
MESFKQRMKRIRVRAGFSSQADAAVAIGCERGTVGMWEAPSSNVKNVSSEWLFAVARAYKVRPDWINDTRSSDDGHPWAPEHAEPVSDDALPSPAVRRESHSQRPDFKTMAAAVELLRDHLDLMGDPPEWIADSGMLEDAYEVIVAHQGQHETTNVIDMAKALARRIRQGESDGGRSSRSRSKAG